MIKIEYKLHSNEGNQTLQQFFNEFGFISSGHVAVQQEDNISKAMLLLWKIKEETSLFEAMEYCWLTAGASKENVLKEFNYE